MPAKRAYGMDQEFYPWSPIAADPRKRPAQQIVASVQVKYLTSATSSGRTQCTRLSTRGRAEAAGARWRNVERHFVCCSNRRRRVFCAMSQARTGSFWVPTIRSRLVIPSQRGSSATNPSLRPNGALFSAKLPLEFFTSIAVVSTTVRVHARRRMKQTGDR